MLESAFNAACSSAEDAVIAASGAVVWPLKESVNVPDAAKDTTLCTSEVTLAIVPEPASVAV
jgi:hypothetical protein